MFPVHLAVGIEIQKGRATLAQKTGMAIVTVLLEHELRVLTTYRPKMDAAIASALAAGTITSAQASFLSGFLDGVTQACTVMKQITGY